MDYHKEQQIKRHQQKWTKWRQEMNRQQQQIAFISEKPEVNAQKYAIKLIQQLQSQSFKNNGYFNKEITKKAGQQCENNICCICLQVMIPPDNIPYILFPCGHNVCKVCLFVDGDQKRDVYKQRLFKCPQCKAAINNFGQNRNLMQLICIFTNNKDLLEKQLDEQMQKQSEQQNLRKLQNKCDVLDRQREKLKNQMIKNRRDQKTLNQVIDQLYQQRRRNQLQLFTLEEEALLIKRHVSQKRQQIQRLKYKIDEQNQQKRNVIITLQPLLMQKQKLQMKLAKKVIGK